MKLKVAKIQWNKKLKLMVKDKYIILSNVEIEKKSSKTEPPLIIFHCSLLTCKRNSHSLDAFAIAVN